MNKAADSAKIGREENKIKFGLDGELEAIAQAVETMRLGFDHQNKVLMSAAVALLKNRQQSPIANAIGQVFETELTKHKLI